ncbi:3956_t:CDS:2 [Acaulospora morrowiae]|uniref:3956_t:CDS:1 n=1 Tax=Acaulospora morrowiae TaxID=94023 RepID=A0A9N9H2A7_9GLOM|nr:3956_t:CDS:2 [Acaulospora morrowiae]
MKTQPYETYLSYFKENKCSSAISFFRHYNFKSNDKATAHHILSKCLKHMLLCSDTELQEKAKNIKKLLENKKNVTDFWTSKKREEKINALEERLKIANKKIVLCDVEQQVKVRELIYQQDNNIRENFNKTLAKPSTPSRKRKSENFEHDKPNKDFKLHLIGCLSESELEDDKNEETSDGDGVIDFSAITLDQFTESRDSKGGWMLKNGERVRGVLIRMTSKAIEQANELQSKKKKLNASILSIIRLGLSSIIDLSSEFSGGMYSWFGDEWQDLKAKALAKINIKPKMFEDLCDEYKYWEARDFVYEKLKVRPDRTETFHRQVMKIYFFIMEMFLVDPYVFVDREGNKQNLTEIEFTLKVVGPIIDIIFSDVQHLVQLKWGETASKAMTVGRKIDLQIMYRGKSKGKNVVLSHSECARRTDSAQIINDRSICLRANKFVLDQYLSHDLSDETIENSAVFGLQLAALYGQVIGVDLLDEGLYFGFEGPLLRFPNQINNITVLKQTLEALYFFKENIVHKAEALSCLNKNSDPFSNTFHTERISKPHHYKSEFIRSITSQKKQTI